jgi:hypothetical protein
VTEWRQVDGSGELMTGSRGLAVFAFYNSNLGEIFFNSRWHGIHYPENFSFRERKADLEKLFKEMKQ